MAKQRSGGKGPQFLKYVRPLVDVLKNNGGSGTTSDIIDDLVASLGISEAELEETISGGQSRVRNHIQWARFYLAKANYMDASQRGVWKLTEKGFKSNFSESDVLALFKSVQDGMKGTKTETASDNTDRAASLDEEIVADETHAEELMRILMSLPPKGFENLCKRLLMEIGIVDVEVTGRAGDQGIDGTGIIKINDVIGFNLIFQCKRYRESVSSPHVRDFRGAMMGRADKGLIITTGRFTTEAKREAVRDGVPPIELIDGERLVNLFEKYRLGLRPRTVFEIELDFFDNFR